MVERMGDDVRARATALLDAVVADRPVGPGRARSRRELPLQVICALLGVPEADEPWLLDCLVRVFGVSDPANGLPISERMRVMEELGAYAHELGRRPPRRPARRPHHRPRARRGGGRRRRAATGSVPATTPASSPPSPPRAARPRATASPTASGCSTAIPDQRASCSRRSRARLRHRGRGDRALREPGDAHAPQRRARHRARRPDRSPPATGSCIWYRSANHDDAVFDDPERFDVTRTRTTTSATAPAARTSAWARTSPGWRSASRSRSSTRRFPDLAVVGRARAGGDAPDQRHQATGRVRPNRVTGRERAG